MYKRNVIIIIIVILILTIIAFASILGIKVKEKKKGGDTQLKVEESNISANNDKTLNQSRYSDDKDIRIIEIDLDSVNGDDLGDSTLSEENVGM